MPEHSPEGTRTVAPADSAVPERDYAGARAHGGRGLCAKGPAKTATTLFQSGCASCEEVFGRR
ncbi:hypothetical protein DICSQDRAFT_133030 [Dichomitus squalens LYAD-421 SS1]|uniref:uncharacterized protein n=1 Tax=Dichomitus squalens (strain LYAD-421) TaxID=732165 RepID=UPI0004410D39|nr:uncharacterized protein DICSQDRAFT_133030 [Dichomitus squalens LYAD-421 SS1]EJF65415.1 hypothetical protein DICSQDRAFT_133030 [Dichomitus squalens LYAD-421 SS1]